MTDSNALLVIENEMQNNMREKMNRAITEILHTINESVSKILKVTVRNAEIMEESISSFLAKLDFDKLQFESIPKGENKSLNLDDIANAATIREIYIKRKDAI